MTENIQVQSRLPQVQTGTFYAAVANFQTKCFKPFAGGVGKSRDHPLSSTFTLVFVRLSFFLKKKKKVIFCIDG